MDGNILFTECAYAAAVDARCFGNHTICWGCFLEKGVHFCIRCKTATYCSKKCQKNDWKNQHKPECDVFLKVKDPEERKILGENYALRLIARVLIRKSSDEREQSSEGEIISMCFREMSCMF